MKARKFYNRVADAYDERFRSTTMELCRKKEKELFDKYAKGRILDLACGTGYWVNRCFVGLDASEAMLMIARDKGRTLMADANNLPLKKGSFDSVILLFSVLRRKEMKGVIRETASLLRENGILIFSTSSIYDNSYGYREKTKLKNPPLSKVYQVKGSKNVRDLFTREEIESMFRAEGFRLEAFDSLFRLQRPEWGNWRPWSPLEKIKLKAERLFPPEYGCMYYFVFQKTKPFGTSHPRQHATCRAQSA